ncbi:MAG: NUDIX hydrolase [Pseudomonadota bacterium]
MSADTPKDAIRNAATVIVVRRDGDHARILMGQRGKKAAFMPSKFVFPGGAVDPQDFEVTAAAPLTPVALEKLSARSDAALAPVLPLTAVRELWEETGLALSTDGPDAVAAPSEWTTFYTSGFRPNASGLDFVFRAITPPGRPRRFDARFFMTDAAGIAGDPDDFSGAADELSHLSWLSIDEARKLDLPFITEVVLAEVEARLAQPDPDRPIPFFYTQDGKSFIDRL